MKLSEIKQLLDTNGYVIIPNVLDKSEVAAALASVDSEFGRTTDPVRMYMREMGSVGLLTRPRRIKNRTQNRRRPAPDCTSSRALKICC